MRTAPQLALAFALPFAALLTSPASAQEAGEKVNMVIIYGDDECTTSADVTTICVVKGEGERFRIPEALRGDPNSPANQTWTDRVEAYKMVGAQGIASCSPVGPGGASGCLTKMIDAAYNTKDGRQDVRFGQLIEAERAKRLSTIDADAAAQQARVETLEKQYDAKLAREREAEDARVPDLPPPPGN